MTPTSILIGTSIGVGLLGIAVGLTPREPRSRPATRSVQTVRRAVVAGAAGLVVGLVTRWPVAGLAVAATVIGFPQMVAGQGRRTSGATRAEAVATWAEMLRDTLAAARGLEEAILATAPLVPLAIRPALARLESRLLAGDRVIDALGPLAEDLDDPTGDLVVAALAMVATGEAQDLGGLLGALAASARDHAALALRIDASRANVRTSVRGVLGFTVLLALALVGLNRSYFAPFGSTQGQLALALAVGSFGVGVTWISRLARPAEPERFLRHAGQR